MNHLDLQHMTKLRNSNPNESEKHRNSSLITSSFEAVTPGKTNMSPENQWLEDVFPIETVPF